MQIKQWVSVRAQPIYKTNTNTNTNTNRKYIGFVCLLIFVKVALWFLLIHNLDFGSISKLRTMELESFTNPQKYLFSSKAFVEQPIEREHFLQKHFYITSGFITTLLRQVDFPSLIRMALVSGQSTNWCFLVTEKVFIKF